MGIPNLISITFLHRLFMQEVFEIISILIFFFPVFDESGHFVLYATMLGIKVLNLHTNRCSRIIGKVSMNQG